MTPTTEDLLSSALKLLSELRDGSPMNEEQKRRYDRLANGEPEETSFDRMRQVLEACEDTDLEYGDLDNFEQLMNMSEQIARACLWTEDENAYDATNPHSGISREWQDWREEQAADWIVSFRKILNIDPGHKDLSK
jgi:hypothetical protein